MNTLKQYAALLGRLLLSSLFIWAGIGKLRAVSGTAQYFGSYHLPAPDILVWIVIIIELIGGLAILVGFKARWVALVLALFCLVTGFYIHLPAGDLPNMINFYKNLSIAGGFLYIFAYGPGILSIDGDKA